MTALSLFIALPWAALFSAGPLPEAPHVRKAIERSLPNLLSGGFYWKERTFTAKKIQCVSCHHVPLAVWSHNLAKAEGFSIDQKKLDALTDWMIEFSAAKKYPDEMVDGFLDTIMLAAEKGAKRNQQAAAFETFRAMMLEQQRPDGSWRRQDHPNEPGFAIIPPQAKKQDAAKREAQEVDTMWGLLGLNALAPLSEAARESLQKPRAAALAFLAESKGSTRNDWLAFRMLIDRDLGDKPKAGTWRRMLLEQQNKNGGWGLVRGDPSHPLVTGQALYALGSAGFGNDDAAVRRAWRFLLRTQRADGSWSASSRAIEDHRNYVTENFGTGWATIGLLRTLPAGTAPERKGQ